MTSSPIRSIWIAGLFALPAAPALTSAAEPAATATPGLEEVVVTARKRSEKARDVPLSVVPLSAQDLADRGATDLKSLGGSVPNVIIGTGDQERRTNLVIRGISTVARSIGQETGVAVYLDGVYTGRAETYNQHLADIDRVEILRGPQGTIFGKNTIAGAISLTTIKPSDTFIGMTSIDAGNFGRVEGSGYVSGPLKGGLLFGKISGYGVTSNGYGKNVFDGSKTGDRNDAGGRVQLRLTPSDRLDLTLSGDVFRHHNAPYKFEVTTGTFGNIPGPFTSDEAYPSRERTSNQGIALNADYQLAGDYTLTSITATRKSSWADHTDETWNGQNLAFSDYTEHSRYFSQELRIASPAGAPVEYVAGVYYSYQKSDTHTPVSVGEDLANLFGIPQGWKSFDLRSDVKTDGYAAFGNASYHVNPRWTLTGGARYTGEKKHLDYVQIDPNGLGFVPNIGPLERHYSKSAFTPTVSAIFAASDRVNLYATFATGFKSGGFNVDTLSSDTRLVFDPEHVNNYEVGAKGVFLDGRVQADFAVFHMDYKDLQVTQYDPASFSNYISNAATAKIDGIEADVVARPAAGWSVTARLGLLKNEFRDFIDQNGNNLNGNHLAFAPKFTGGLATMYLMPMGERSSAFVRAEYNYRSLSHPDVTNLPVDELQGYGLLDARMGLTFGADKWMVEAYGRNLTNKLYASSRQTQLPLLSFLPPYNYDETTTTFGMPRTYGVKVTARF